MSLKRTLKNAHSLATRYAPTQVTIYEVTYASADDPRDTTSQATFTTHRIRAIFAPVNQDKEPVTDQVTDTATLSYRLDTLGHVVTQGDRVEVGGVVYNVTDSKTVADAIVVASVSGPTISPVETGDVTPPRVTAGSVSAGDPGIINYTATISESSYWRIRYRTPPATGTWATGAFSASATTSVSASVGALDSGLYEVAIQPKDEAGNVGAWYDLGNVSVTPDLGS